MAAKRSKSTRRADSQAASVRAAAIRKEQERKEARRRNLAVTAVVVVVLAIVLAIWTGTRSSDDSSATTAKAPAGAVGGYAVPVGKSSAPVKVVLYEDFMCPICGELEAASRTQFDKDIAAGKVQFQYHALSFLDRSSSTKYSTRAANALGVVLDTSGPTAAKKFHDLLYEHQPQEGSAGLSDSQLVTYAVQAGAKKSAVKAGIDDLRFGQWVKKVADKASKDKVNGTPTAVIDGKTVTATGSQLVTTIQAAIDKG